MLRARQPGALLHDFGEVEQLQVSRKGPADFVSEADRRAEQIIKAELSKARPGFSMLLEEEGAVGSQDAADRWIVDPLDGTTNFLHGIPHFAISIAHEQNGELVAGMVYDPTRDETFWAVKGAGCFLGNTRLRVSARDQSRHRCSGNRNPVRQSSRQRGNAGCTRPRYGSHGRSKKIWGRLSRSCLCSGRPV